jgi:3-dehydroquinate dehydratase-2
MLNPRKRAINPVCAWVFPFGSLPDYKGRIQPPIGVPLAKSGKQNKALPIYVLNGPTLNLLGTREPEIYGHTTLADIGKLVTARAKTHGLAVVFRHSNHEGTLIDWIQEARQKGCGVILNGGAYTHTSIAIYDALKSLGKPIIEVHLSNPHARERFRHRSFVSMVANGVICGLKEQGYLAAVDAMATLIKGQS